MRSCEMRPRGISFGGALGGEAPNIDSCATVFEGREPEVTPRGQRVAQPISALILVSEQGEGLVPEEELGAVSDNSLLSRTFT